MLTQRLFFPAVYPIFLMPDLVGSAWQIKVAVLMMCPVLALMINAHSVGRIASLFLAALGTLLPFLLIVQSAVCTSPLVGVPHTFVVCVTEKSLGVILNVSLLSAIFMLAAANEWRGSLVETINKLYLPRSVRMMAIISGAMVGEFRRAMIRVHHAFTARGTATPSISWRNLIALPAMLGAVWASVLSGVVERMKGQWSSDDFWSRYVPLQRPNREGTVRSDLAVLVAAVLVAGALSFPGLF